MAEKADKLKLTLPGLLATEFPLVAQTRDRMLRVVPWEGSKGYAAMLRFPRQGCKGVFAYVADEARRGA
eukprot:2931353-Lingulodinium_polyedra.AAC.1